MHYVYLLKSSEDKYYVGVTCDLTRRLNAHLHGYGSRLVKEALQKGVSFTHSILFEGSGCEAYLLESDFIVEYNSLDPNGYNLAPGGWGGGISDRKGSSNTQAILNEDKVLEIRELYANLNITQEILASRYKVNRETISALVRGKSWKEVGGPITVKSNDKIKLDQYSIDLIQFLRKEDKLTYQQISDELKIKYSTVAKYGSMV